MVKFYKTNEGRVDYLMERITQRAAWVGARQISQRGMDFRGRAEFFRIFENV